MSDFAYVSEFARNLTPMGREIRNSEPALRPLRSPALEKDICLVAIALGTSRDGREASSEAFRLRLTTHPFRQALLRKTFATELSLRTTCHPLNKRCGDFRLRIPDFTFER